MTLCFKFHEGKSNQTVSPHLDVGQILALVKSLKFLLACQQNEGEGEEEGKEEGEGEGTGEGEGEGKGEGEGEGEGKCEGEGEGKCEDEDEGVRCRVR
jgi:hypothetical protein